jgi:hypothetical protein
MFFMEFLAEMVGNTSPPAPKRGQGVFFFAVLGKGPEGVEPEMDRKERSHVGVT